MANLFDNTGNDYLAEPTQDTQLRHSFGPGVFNATTAPTVDDDELDGFRPMSHWYDSVAEKLYICVDSSEGAAVWEEISLGPGGGGSGDVVGPASATDNAIARYDGTTGKLIQNSTVTLSDVGTLGNVNAVDFDLSPSGSTPAALGRLVWDTTENTLEMGIGTGSVTSLIGVDNHIQVYQQTGSTIARAKVVQVIGSSGLKLEVGLAKGDADTDNAQTIGLTAEAISNNGEGYVITRGLLRDCNTSPFNEDDVLWISPTTFGEITNVRPTAPDHAVRVGYCVKKSAAQGIIYVDILNGYELDELHNVLISGVGADHFLVYDATSGQTRWENRSPADARTALGLGSLALQGDGDKGDITVASSGASWTIDSGAVTDAKIASGVDALKIGAGSVSNTEFGYLDGVTSAIQTQIDGKVTSNVAITGATKTKITYDSKGLVTSGADATTSDIAEGTNLYFTDERAQDAVGTILTDTSTIDFSYNDAGAQITADIKTGSIGTSLLGGDITTAGKALLDDADASAQRTTLGLGTIATQNANNVSITGGTATGLTDSAAQFTNTGLQIRDNQIVGSYNLTLAVAESLTAARTLSIVTNNASRTLTISGNATVSGTNTGDQTITLTGDVTGSGTGSFAATIANGAVTNAKLQNSSVTVNGTSIALGASGTVTATATNALTIGTGLSGTSYNGSAGVTIAIDSTVATLTGSQTLSNKSIALGSNTVTGTKAEFDTAVTDDNFAYVGTANAFTGANTFTNATGQIYRQAATQDGILIRGRAGGTTSLTAEIIPPTLSSSIVITLPSSTATLTGLGLNNAFTGANTFTNSTGQIFRQAATQDGVLIRGRAGGTTSLTVELIPGTLTASRTLTAPDVTGTIATGTGAANRVAYWSGTNALTSSASFAYDGTTVTAGQVTIANDGSNRGSISTAANALMLSSAAAADQIISTSNFQIQTKTFTIRDSNIAATTVSIPWSGNGYFNQGNIAIGSTSPSARLHLTSTTEQLRIAYDTNNFTKFTVGSTGTLSIAALSTNGASSGIVQFSNSYVQFGTGGNLGGAGTWFPYSDGNNYISATSTIFRDSTNTTFLTLSNTSATYIDGVNMAFGTTTGTKIGTATTQKIGFYNVTPVIQPETTGTATGFVAGTGTAVREDSTFTGGSGTKAYRISDIVKALKDLGLLKA